MTMNEDINERRAIFEAWKKHNNREKLDALQKQIVKAISMHPEFSAIVENPDKYERYSFKPDETDPFAHIALHSIIREMISTDSPQGIREIYDISVSERGDKHEVQHRFMEAYFSWIVAQELQQESNDDQENPAENFLDYLWNELNPIEEEIH